MTRITGTPVLAPAAQGRGPSLTSPRSGEARRLRWVAALSTAGVVAVTCQPGSAYTRPGETHMVSNSVSGGDLTDSRNKPFTRPEAVSGDGRYVAFTSAAQDMVPEAQNPNGTLAKTVPVTAVFVHDEKTGKNTVVSVRSDGKPVLCPLGSLTSCTLGSHASISDDGRYVAFASGSPNLVDLDTNLVEDIFVRDLKLGSTVRVSVNSLSVAGDKTSRWPSISGDGRYVAFESESTNLVTGDTNNGSDIFVALLTLPWVPEGA